MSFRWPELLWAVLLVPLVLLVWMRGERRRGQRAVAFGNPALLPNMVTARPGWRRVVPIILYLLAATVLLLALARPEATAQVPRDQATIMLVMDTSRSMLNTDLSPSRREAAQQAADAFLQEIPDRFQVGLVSFSPGELVLKPLRPLGADWTRDLAAALKDVTGSRWTVSFTDQGGEPSLQQQEQIAEETMRAAVLDEPNVRAVMETFPDATLESFSKGA